MQKPKTHSSPKLLEASLRPSAASRDRPRYHRATSIGSQNAAPNHKQILHQFKSAKPTQSSSKAKGITTRAMRTAHLRLSRHVRRDGTKARDENMNEGATATRPTAIERA